MILFSVLSLFSLEKGALESEVSFDYKGIC